LLYAKNILILMQNDNFFKEKMIKRKREIGEYGRQLREKQDLKKIYGLREGPMRKYVEAAKKMPGNASENLLILLERRLDNLIFRAGFAITRPQARQYANHGLFLLNGKRVNIPSILVNIGDIIEPRNKDQFPEKPKKDAWFNTDDSKVIIQRLPTREDIDTPINENLVMQFYSR